MVKEHGFRATVRWTGARKRTSFAHRDYSREREAVMEDTPVLRLSGDGAFLDDDAQIVNTDVRRSREG